MEAFCTKPSPSWIFPRGNVSIEKSVKVAYDYSQFTANSSSPGLLGV